MQRGRSGSMYNNRFKVKKGCCSWDHEHEHHHHHHHHNLQEGDLVAAAGFSWPPRSYTCSFCKREFRSAQALGGHMNVHRRDRARLRQSPTRDEGQFSLLIPDLEPSMNFNSNPNSSPSFTPTFSSLFTKYPNFNPMESNTCGQEGEISAQSCVRPLTKDLMTMKAPRGGFPVKRNGSQEGVKDCDVLKKAEFVRLELEIGLISDCKEELDLELRLGCTN